MKLLTRIRKRAQKLSPTSRKGLKGVGWIGISQVFGMVVRLVSNLILTRLLAPSAFGLMGTAQALAETLVLFSDLAMGPALVRHPRGTERAFLMTGWWVNLGRMFLVTSSLSLMAIPLSHFYKQPELAPVLFVVALRPLVQAFRSPASPNLQREMRYRTIYIQEMLLTFLSMIVSVTLVWFHRSTLALAVGMLIGTCMAMALTYVFNPMRPALLWDKTAAKELGQFGRSVFVNTLAMALWMNIDRIFGLRMVSAKAMGYYALATNLCAIINAITNKVARGIYYVMLLKRGEGMARLQWHSRMINRLSTIVMPGLALGIVAAPIVVDVLYDDRWRPASALLAILIGQSMLRMLNQFEFQYLMSTASVAIQTRAYVVASVAQAALFYPLVTRWRETGMAVSTLLSSMVLVIAQSIAMRVKTGHGGYVPMATTMGCIAAALTAYWLIWGR